MLRRRELGLLIGKHGQTIDAIQYLVNAIVRRGGERARRRSSSTRPATAPGGRATLETLAVRSAERALRRGGASSSSR